MAQSLGKLLVHVVYSTKNRAPLLSPIIRPKLYAYTVGILNTLDCVTLAVNGTEDHVHALVSMSRNISVAKMVEDMKRGSSRWIKEQDENFRYFLWQNGYGAFSVSESRAAQVVEYIKTQEEHHRKIPFQEEFRLLLKKHSIEFDERYLWG
jgi:Transposase and inactivated derivatives